MMDSDTDLELFVNSPKHTDDLLVAELELLGARGLHRVTNGASFTANVEVAYRICLWSRIANRVLLRQATIDAADPEVLYRGVRGIDWSTHLGPTNSLSVDVTARRPAIGHTHYAALKVKDAIVDQFRDAVGERPGVDTEAPDLRINIHLDGDRATVSIDLSGGSLHRRGYRAAGTKAPLKENLAAAILIRAGWPDVAREAGALVDPMCGSGTLLIEAVLLAADIAPGLFRQRFGFSRWRRHHRPTFERLVSEAELRRQEGLAAFGADRIHGYDIDPEAVRNAQRNVVAAGLAGQITIVQADIDRALRPMNAGTGLVVANPPYGERLRTTEPLPELYQRLGARLASEFCGWRAAVLTSDPALGKCLGMKAVRRHALYNGAIPCVLLHFDLGAARGSRRPPPDLSLDPLANRLRKNIKRLGRWAGRRGITCYRLYDADLPEFAVAVDRYGPELHVQEYRAPPEVDERTARRRLAHIMAVLPEVLDISADKIHLKVRRKQKGKSQYQRQGFRGELLEVDEGGHTFLVNLTDYLDTGLFLDHRPTRALLATLAPERDFLNLFAYTGAATVYAARAGATSTTSVDLSNTYTRWADDNLRLNGITGPRHQVLRADCLTFLREHHRRYGLIFLDPPTFSNSKATARAFDLQRDHVGLLTSAAELLTPGGVLIFSCNFRRFRLDVAALPGLAIENITTHTIDEDFRRNPRIHQCFRINRR